MEKIPSTMKALVCYGPHDYRYEERPMYEAGEEDILIKVEACGICAGDIKSFQGAAMFWGDGKLLPRWNDPPVVPGHEFVGTVAAIGEKAKKRRGLKVGDRAIAEQIVPCGRCRFCLTGEWWMCEEAHIHGHQKGVADGGMAEYMLYGPNDIVHKVPEELPIEAAAMIEPVSCSVHTIERAGIELQDVVVIAGLGPIGLCKLQLAKLKSPRLLIGLDIKENRLQLAKELGADFVFNPLKCNVVEEIKKLTDGYGCDVYIHNSGSPEGVYQGLDMLRKKGKFVEFSVFSKETSLDWSVIGDRKELTIYGSHISGQNGYSLAIDLLNKQKIKVDKIVTHKFRLSEWEKAFNTAKEAKDSLKVILIP